jgi:monofunctional biosynthetic peptidoglycan transglycosylase
MIRLRTPITGRKVFRFILWAAVAVVAFQYYTLPGVGVVTLRDRNPEMSALMKQRWEESGGTLPIRYAFVPIEKISPNFVRAVIAVEDGGFYRHAGVDWNALDRARKRNERAGKVRFGGSTITMQLAKNLFLSSERSYTRKAKEMILTFRLERHLSKKRILELYLNIIELGDGIFGAEAASQHYFGHSAATLSVDESTRLAAIISSPRKHSPFENSRFLNTRKNVIKRKTGR